MTGWDGRGLPPAAQARMKRFAATNLKTSLLSVPAALSLESVGFEPVGEVMGCTVDQIGWPGYAGCPMGQGPYSGLAYQTPRTSSRDPNFGFKPYVSAVHRGYATALRRMTQEASALGADGVVGVLLRADPVAEHTTEFVALGTAVRARCRTRPSKLFTTELPGTDVAKLLMAGWIPVAVHVALEVAIRHDDDRTWLQANGGPFNVFGRSNVEISGYTKLVQRTRALARDRMARQMAELGADGVVVSDFQVRLKERGCDHVAEATIRGTSIARFRRRARAASDHAPLSILPLAMGR